MMIVARSMSYQELLGKIRGRKAAIWTCNTCARLCGGTGGAEAAERLSDHLGSDGVDVVSVVSVSASCMMSKVEGRIDPGCDAIVSLACDLGSECVRRVAGKEVISPLVTLGSGILDSQDRPMVVHPDGSFVSLEDAASEAGAESGPYF